jgi:predicted phosphoadenosine phosphosulfate sulfurtransferase
VALNYLNKTVLEAAVERINFVFDNCDDILVSMSGGKDSTVLYHLALAVARERGRLPLKVWWLDQEAEWQATEDYMRTIFYGPEIRPFWFQVPFRLTNSLSFRDNYLYCWRPEDEAIWIRPQDPLSIKVNPLPQYDRFRDLISWLPTQCDFTGKRHVGVLVGLRAIESPSRRATTTQSIAHFKGITWCRKMIGNTRVFWPLYDWSDPDIWTAIARFGWPYNAIYDSFYRYGIKGPKMRVSALIHETAWHAIELLQEVEPRMYNRYLARVNGVNCFAHFKHEIMPSKLPAAFRDWQDYRDYLLENLIEPQHHETFRRRWATGAGHGGQTGERWWKVHVKEIMVNDIDGTLNDNYRMAFILEDRSQAGGRYVAKRAKRFQQHLASQK